MTPTHVVSLPTGRLVILATDERRTEGTWLPALLEAVGTPETPVGLSDPSIAGRGADPSVASGGDEVGRRRRLRSVLSDVDEDTYVVAFNAACTTVLDQLAALSRPWRLGGLLFCLDSAFDVGGISTAAVAPRGAVLASLRRCVRRRMVVSANGANDVPPTAAAEFARLIAAQYQAISADEDGAARTRAGGAAALAPLVRWLTAPSSETEETGTDPQTQEEPASQSASPSASVDEMETATESETAATYPGRNAAAGRVRMVPHD